MDYILYGNDIALEIKKTICIRLFQWPIILIESNILTLWFNYVWNAPKTRNGEPGTGKRERKTGNVANPNSNLIKTLNPNPKLLILTL